MEAEAENAVAPPAISVRGSILKAESFHMNKSGYFGTSACKCGNLLMDCMNFCGMCGAARYWTCGACQYNENLGRFAFCSNCGVTREVATNNPAPPPRMIRFDLAGGAIPD